MSNSLSVKKKERKKLHFCFFFFKYKSIKLGARDLHSTSTFKIQLRYYRVDLDEITPSLWKMLRYYNALTQAQA